MNRHGIVHERPDTPICKILPKLVAPAATNDIKMINVCAVLHARRLCDQRVRDLAIIQHRYLLPAAVPGIEMRQLCQENRGLNFVQAAVVALDTVIIAPLLSVIPELQKPCRQIIIIGCDGAAVAKRAKILTRVEAETTGPSDHAELSALVGCPVTLRYVFDHRNAMTVADLNDRIEVGRLTIEMNRDHGLCLFGARALELLGIQSKTDGIDVDQHRHRAYGRDRGDGRYAGIGNGDHAIAGFDVTGCQSQVQGFGAGADADDVLDAQIAGKARFELFHLGAENKPAAFEDAL